MERRRVEGRRILVGGAGFGFEGRARGEGAILGRAGGPSARLGSKPEILGERGGGGSGERAEGEGDARFWVAALHAAREGGGRQKIGGAI